MYCVGIRKAENKKRGCDIANKIADIDALESILTKRKSPKGVQIGHFWSVLQIYLCIKKLGISIKTLCDIASMISDRVDSKYNKTAKKINHMMIRKHLHLESTPCQVSHTVVTKTVSKGMDNDTRNNIQETLIRFNSYGPKLEDALCDVVEKGKGRLVSTKATTMGVSDFTAVLQISLILLDMDKLGYFDEISEIKNKNHQEFIIRKIKDYQKSNDNTEDVGISF